MIVIFFVLCVMRIITEKKCFLCLSHQKSLYLFPLLHWMECPKIACKERKLPDKKNHSFNLCCPTAVSKIISEPVCLTSALEIIKDIIFARKFSFHGLISACPSIEVTLSCLKSKVGWWVRKSCQCQIHTFFYIKK